MSVLMIDKIVTDYDRANFLTYARLLDAERFGQAWEDAAAEILGLHVSDDELNAFRIWRDHVDRAEWIVGEGLALIARNRTVLGRLIH